jgi:glutamate formiminotransferase
VPLLAIPNVSEGREDARIRGFTTTVEKTGVRVLDVHSDAVHNRSVLTVTGSDSSLAQASAELAAAARIDLTRHEGIHPRLGGLDVCPFVPHGATSMNTAIRVAHRAGAAINERTGLPVYYYGRAALRDEMRELPDLRRGGIQGLRARAVSGVPPDLGPAEIDPAVGVVCVGARGPLIAFNVWLICSQTVAAAIASRVRASGGGLSGVRALGLAVDDETAQVSMNLTSPAVTGIDTAFSAVDRLAREMNAEITATEIVGLVPEQFLPDPKARAARMLISPGRSIDAALNP